MKSRVTLQFGFIKHHKNLKEDQEESVSRSYNGSGLCI